MVNRRCGCEFELNWSWCVISYFHGFIGNSLVCVMWGPVVRVQAGRSEEVCRGGGGGELRRWEEIGDRRRRETTVSLFCVESGETEGQESWEPVQQKDYLSGSIFPGIGFSIIKIRRSHLYNGNPSHRDNLQPADPDGKTHVGPVNRLCIIMSKIKPNSGTVRQKPKSFHGDWNPIP